MPLPGQPDDIPTMPEDFDYDNLYWSILGHLTEKYMWNTWGDNCAVCNALRGKVYTLDFWANVGLWPGFHLHCDCTMKRVSPDTPTSDPDFFGMNIPQYQKMWNPIPQFIWDPAYLIQPWQVSVVQQIEQMHLAYGADMPMSEAFKQWKNSGFFNQRPSIVGDLASGKILATSRYLQEIDGGYSGSRFFTLENVGRILEPFWRWFEQRWKTNAKLEENLRFSQGRRTDTPSFLRPAALRPWQPFQSNYTEVGN